MKPVENKIIKNIEEIGIFFTELSRLPFNLINNKKICQLKDYFFYPDLKIPNKFVALFNSILNKTLRKTF